MLERVPPGRANGFALLSIQRLSPTDAPNAQRWDAFVMACPGATFFHRAAWQGIIAGIFRHDTYFLYAESDGQIQGILPLAHVNSMLFGNALVGLPFAVYGGVAATTEQAALALEAGLQAAAARFAAAHLP